MGMGKRDGANSRFSQFCKRALKLKLLMSTLQHTLPILHRILSEKLRRSGFLDSVINTFYMYVSSRNYHFSTLHAKLFNTKPVIVSGPVLLVVCCCL